MTNGKETTKQTARRSKKNNKESRIPDYDSVANILERISDGFVAFDAQMNYTYVNERSGELLGRKPENLIGKNYWKEYPEAKGTPFADAYVRALKTRNLFFLRMITHRGIAGSRIVFTPPKMGWRSSLRRSRNASGPKYNFTPVKNAWNASLR